MLTSRLVITHMLLSLTFWSFISLLITVQIHWKEGRSLGFSAQHSVRTENLKVRQHYNIFVSMHGNFASFRNTYSTFSITDCQKQTVRSIEQPNSMVIDRKSVTSRCHGSKISGSQQYFLDRDGRSFALSNDAKRYGLPFCSLVQSCTGMSFSPLLLFFCHI